MPTVSRELPKQPHIDIPKRQARELLALWRAADPEALARIRARIPRFASLDDPALAAATFRLADAQLVIAREYGSAHWTELKQRITESSLLVQLRIAIHADDRATVIAILRRNPHLLHVPVWSGNWGPPLSHAANLGRLEIMQAVAALGARDHAHAFGRALLQGEIESARWLHSQGVKPSPGDVMGCCECLNADGLRFLAELGAPFTDDHGDRLAPLALVLETYGRNSTDKHAVLEILAAQVGALPDTPMVAFHRGQVDRLRDFIDRDPGLLARRFAAHEIYPAALGCQRDGLNGMCGTPTAGTTLLHLAIDFKEEEIFDFLLGRGADPNAPAAVDAEGFGGHTPLYHAVVACGIACDLSWTQKLLARGATPGHRTTLRKFLDWRDQPGWHIARDATAADWGRTFPERRWVNEEAVALLG